MKLNSVRQGQGSTKTVLRAHGRTWRGKSSLVSNLLSQEVIHTDLHTEKCSRQAAPSIIKWQVTIIVQCCYASFCWLSRALAKGSTYALPRRALNNMKINLFRLYSTINSSMTDRQRTYERWLRLIDKDSVPYDFDERIFFAHF